MDTKNRASDDGNRPKTTSRHESVKNGHNAAAWPRPGWPAGRVPVGLFVRGHMPQKYELPERRGFLGGVRRRRRFLLLLSAVACFVPVTAGGEAGGGSLSLLASTGAARPMVGTARHRGRNRLALVMGLRRRNSRRPLLACPVPARNSKQPRPNEVTGGYGIALVNSLPKSRCAIDSTDLARAPNV